MLSKEEFENLVKLVDQALYHSHLVTGRFVSSLHVKIPIPGSMDHMLKLERSVVANLDRSVKNEEEAAGTILARDLKYLFEDARQWSEPVFQQNEEGEPICIGQNIVFVDRNRIKKPKLGESFGSLFIDMTE